MSRGSSPAKGSPKQVDTPQQNEGTGKTPSEGGDFASAKPGRGADRATDQGVAPGFTPTGTESLENDRFPTSRGRGKDQPEKK